MRITHLEVFSAILRLSKWLDRAVKRVPIMMTVRKSHGYLSRSGQYIRYWWCEKNNQQPFEGWRAELVSRGM